LLPIWKAALDQTRFEPGRVRIAHQSRPLWVGYDLAAVGKALETADLCGHPASLYRHRELLALRLD
jgi:hypothetical protein